MSETPTPSLLQDWLREKARVPYFAAYRGDLLSIAHALDSLHRALTAERAARERAEAENDTLRGLLGNSGKPCAHCGLPVERWGECAHGFPGCARADDAQLSDLFAVRAEIAEAEAERNLTVSQLLAVSCVLARDDKEETTDHPRWTPALETARGVMMALCSAEAERDALLARVRDDALAMTCQSIGQYRKALMAAAGVAKTQDSKEARRDAAERRSWLVDEYVAEYEYGDEGYVPTDDERAMLADFAHGLIAHLDAAIRAATRKP